MHSLIIDTDCGVDDAVAIIMALNSNVQIGCISTVSGNVGVEQVTKNVVRLLGFLGHSNIPVYKGATRPLVERELFTAPIHGKNGFGNVDLPDCGKKEESENAITGIYKTISSSESVDLIALGPLTNIAMLLNIYPDAKNMISRIVAMGGAIERGNVTRFAEFNFRADPEAADFVMRSGIPITLVPWDPIFSNPFPESELLEMFKGKGKEGDLIYQIEQVVVDFAEKYFGIRGVYLPDPMAMGVYLDPRIVKKRQMANIVVELSSTTLRGASVICEGDSTEVVLEIDKEVFNKLVKKII